MAVVRYGPVVASARGSIGGVTFGRRWGTSTAGIRRLYVNPESVRQLENRMTYRRVTAGWAGLTDEERATWVQFALSGSRSGMFGEGRHLSGFQLYCKFNLRCDAAGLPEVRSIGPNAGTVVPANVDLEVYPGGPVLLMSDAGPPGVDWLYRIFVQSLGEYWSGLPPRRLAGIGNVTGVTFGSDVYEAARQVLGEINPGMRVRWQINQWYEYAVGEAITSGIAEAPREGHTLVSNGSFESGVDGQVPTSWNYEGDGSCVKVETDAFSDTHDAWWQHPGGGVQGQFSTDLGETLYSGKTYRLRLAGHWESGQVSYAFGYSLGKPHLVFSNAFGALGTGWTRYEFDATPGEDMPGAKLVFAYWGAGILNCSLDLVDLREVF